MHSFSFSKSTFLHRTFNRFIHSLSLVFLLIFLCTNLTAVSSTTFDQNLVINDQTLYSLPKNFNSIASIQSYLESKNSILATYKVKIGLYKGGDCQTLNGVQVCYNSDKVALASTFPGVPDNLVPAKILQPFDNTEMNVSEFIWRMSRTGFASGCSPDFLLNLCYDQSSKPINPGFLLALIQKESGLVYGVCAKPDADQNNSCYYTKLYTDAKTEYENALLTGDAQKIQQAKDKMDLRTKFLLGGRMDRATGYYCFETADKSKGCWDENSNWWIYKGLFRQLYHAIRRLRLLEQACIKGYPYSFSNSSGNYIVGNTVIVDGQPVVLKNGITCALYVYTPHISDKELIFAVMRDLKADYTIENIYNLPTNYTMKPVLSF